MTLMKSFRTVMDMKYDKYEKVLVGYGEIDFSGILDKFVKDMFNGPREEIARFFNLDEDDLNDMTDDNFMIGYKILSIDEENKRVRVNVKLDIKIPNQDDNKPDDIVDIDENPASFDEGVSMFDKIDEAREMSDVVADSDYSEVTETTKDTTDDTDESDKEESNDSSDEETTEE